MNDLLKVLAMLPAGGCLAVAVLLACGALCLVIALVGVTPGN